MKKGWLPLLALFLLLAGCTGSCGTQNVAGTAQPEQSVLPPASASAAPAGTSTPEATADSSPTTPMPSPETVATPSPEPSPEAVQTPEPEAAPTDEEVLEAYRLAQQAWSWFQVSPMPFDPTDSREVDGVTYYRVDYPGISSLSALRGYLKSLFSDALVDTLLPYEGVQYLEFDGALFVQDGGRGTDIYRGAEYTQVMRGDNPNRLAVLVTVEVVDPEQDGAVTGTEEYEFPYEKVGERWIFTDFSLTR